MLIACDKLALNELWVYGVQLISSHVSIDVSQNNFKNKAKYWNDWDASNSFSLSLSHEKNEKLTCTSNEFSPRKAWIGTNSNSFFYIRIISKFKKKVSPLDVLVKYYIDTSLHLTKYSISLQDEQNVLSSYAFSRLGK